MQSGCSLCHCSRALRSISIASVLHLMVPDSLQYLSRKTVSDITTTATTSDQQHLVWITMHQSWPWGPAFRRSHSNSGQKISGNRKIPASLFALSHSQMCNQQKITEISEASLSRNVYTGVMQPTLEVRFDRFHSPQPLFFLFFSVSNFSNNFYFQLDLKLSFFPRGVKTGSMKCKLLFFSMRAFFSSLYFFFFCFFGVFNRRRELHFLKPETWINRKKPTTLATTTTTATTMQLNDRFELKQLSCFYFLFGTFCCCCDGRTNPK